MAVSHGSKTLSIFSSSRKKADEKVEEMNKEIPAATLSVCSLGIFSNEKKGQKKIRPPQKKTTQKRDKKQDRPPEADTGKTIKKRSR